MCKCCHCCSFDSLGCRLRTLKVFGTFLFLFGTIFALAGIVIGFLSDLYFHLISLPDVFPEYILFAYLVVSTGVVALGTGLVALYVSKTWSDEYCSTRGLGILALLTIVCSLATVGVPAWPLYENGYFLEIPPQTSALNATTLSDATTLLPATTVPDVMSTMDTMSAVSNMTAMNETSMTMNGTGINDTTSMNTTSMNMTSMNMTSMNMTSMNMTSMNMTSMNMTSMNMTSMNMTSMNMTSMNMTSMNMTSMNMTSMNMTSMNMTSMNMTSMNMTSVDSNSTESSNPTESMSTPDPLMTTGNFTSGNFTCGNSTDPMVTRIPIDYDEWLLIIAPFGIICLFALLFVVCGLFIFCIACCCPERSEIVDDMDLYKS